MNAVMTTKCRRPGFIESRSRRDSFFIRLYTKRKNCLVHTSANSAENKPDNHARHFHHAISKYKNAIPK